MNQTAHRDPADGFLVIGYGNELRGDDGVGPKIAAAVEALHLPGVRVIICQQLSPEHAEPVARARVVVFVDAAVDAPRVAQMRKLAPAASSQVIAHAASTATVLALARELFGRAPAAWWLTIPVENLGLGEALSPLARHGFELAVEEIERRGLSGRIRHAWERYA